MYEAEYRLALRNSGFDGFRVLLFQQSGGLSQSDAEAGLEMNLDFFLGILNALNCGDVLNEVAYRSVPTRSSRARPTARSTHAMDDMHEVFRTQAALEARAAAWRRYLGGFADTAEYIGKFVNQLQGRRLHCPRSSSCRDLFDEIEVDRLRVKPIVKITGEFWAQTTEGDGNFNMFRFLEREGAQVLVEPIGTWIMYMIHQVVQKYRDLQGPRRGRRAAARRGAWTSARSIELELPQQGGQAEAGRGHLQARVPPIVDALGGIAHHLADQYELQRLGHPFYNSRAGGGEGHLEVAKNIYYSQQGPGPHGAVAEAVRLHALHAVRRRAGGRGLALTAT